MAKIVVFDSGLGSLSIIKALQKKIKADYIYFADQKNFPYGTKSIPELKKIIKFTILMLKKKFKPDLIIIGSNTPSLLLKKIIIKPRVIGVFPPLKEAVKNTKTGIITILATKSVVKSIALKNYIKKNVPKEIKVVMINASPLVELVESGKFINDKKFCEKEIRTTLKPMLKNNIDVATLSSTHLPFLVPLLKKVFPYVKFLDPREIIANQTAKICKRSSMNTLKIFTSGDADVFQRLLYQLNIKNKVIAI